MIIVDTTVWIDFFNGRENEKTRLLEHLLSIDRIVILDIIKIELLQGTKTEKEFEDINSAISLLQYRESLNDQTIDLSIKIYRKLRKRGITIRKTIDTIIAAVCLVNNYSILHNDSDFSSIAKYYDINEL